jgi:hypothetical protein
MATSIIRSTFVRFIDPPRFILNVAPHAGQNFAFRSMGALQEGQELPTSTRTASAETTATPEGPSEPAAEPSSESSSESAAPKGPSAAEHGGQHQSPEQTSPQPATAPSSAVSRPPRHGREDDDHHEQRHHTAARGAAGANPSPTILVTILRYPGQFHIRRIGDLIRDGDRPSKQTIGKPTSLEIRREVLSAERAAPRIG